MISNVFLGGYILSKSPFEFYIGYTFIIAFLLIYLLCYRKVQINYSFICILFILAISSLINIFFGNNTWQLFIKQIVGIFLTGVAYYLLIRVNDFEVEKLFRIYLRLAFIVAAIGIFQEASFLIGFERGYNYINFMTKWWLTPPTSFGMLQVNSILMEPSHFAAAIAPAAFVSLERILKHKASFLGVGCSLVIIISFLLTFSTLAYIVILISLTLLLIDIKKRRYFLLLLLIPAFAVLVYSFIPGVRVRVNGTAQVISGEVDVLEVNPSTYSLASNLFVAMKGFSANPFFGYGLGSHPLTYVKELYPGTYWYRKDIFGLNKKGAGSLFIRLLSETGLFGLLIVLFFIFRLRIRNSNDKNLKVMSNAIFSMFIIQLIRQGHYFYNGLFFFVWMYYFIYLNNRRNIQKRECDDLVNSEV